MCLFSLPFFIPSSQLSSLDLSLSLQALPLSQDLTFFLGSYTHSGHTPTIFAYSPKPFIASAFHCHHLSFCYSLHLGASCQHLLKGIFNLKGTKPCAGLFSKRTSKKSRVYSEEVTPVPISNTVVKLFCADDTWWATARESRTMRV